MFEMLRLVSFVFPIGKDFTVSGLEWFHL